MDKKTIIGIVVMGVLFFGFTYFSNKEQAEKQQQMAAWQAQQDSLEAAKRLAEAPVVATDTTAVEAAVRTPEEIAADNLKRRIEREGEYLAAAESREAEELSVENDQIKVLFSTKGAQIKGVTLKNYYKYAAPDQPKIPIELFDPAQSDFNLEFSVRKGTMSLPVNTRDYVFEADPVVKNGDGNSEVTMRLRFTETAALEYRYVVRDNADVEHDQFLVDFNVKMVGMDEILANQSKMNICWGNTSYQNEKGFKNENMYTTIAYRLPEETAIEEIGMSEEAKGEEITSAVNWVAFKQQYFSSVMIAPKNFSYANMKFETEKPGTGYVKHFMSEMTVPFEKEASEYNFGFYFGPNKYSLLNKVAEDNELFGDLHLERLVPLGWGIFGWVNRYCVIPVFDFLRQFISSFGIIILILVFLVKLVISPMTYKSYVSMAKMRLIKPQTDEINKKYPKPEDAMKRQQETMALYKKAGINPMGGCLPMLIQLPILYAMFRFFPASIELRGQAFLWADDLSSYDSVLELPFSIPWYGDHISLFALLMAVSLFAYSLYNYKQTSSSQPQMAGMKFMMVYMMPIMMLLWFNSYSSGLCYYYLLSNLFTIVQTQVIRHYVDDSKIQAIMAQSAAKKSNGKKSKFQLRYEELMRQQEEKMKQQGRK